VPGRPTWRFEREAWKEGYRLVAGLDEAGRGCLAGPVVAAAVVLDPSRRLAGVDDSKRLTARQRETLYGKILSHARAWGVGVVEASEIDRTDILAATRQAMGQAVRALGPAPDFLLTDAVDLSGCGAPCRALIGGDRLSLSIAAASILAKVTRDRRMEEADGVFPGYGFARHKGYGTAEHLEELRRRGPCAIHRKTFYGVSIWQPPLPFGGDGVAGVTEGPDAS